MGANSLGWERRQTREMILKALEREPDITTAELVLRFGISGWTARSYRRAFKRRIECERAKHQDI